MFVDTHCHIYSEYYDDIAKVIKDSEKVGVKVMISAGVDQRTNEELLKLANIYPNMYICLGIHPENVDNFQEEDLTFIEKNLPNPKVIAIGEIGLDYHYEGYNKESQIILFEKQLFLAEKYHLPVVIHSRDAEEDTINILKKYHLHGVIHSFSGNADLAKNYIKLGYKLGVNGIVTFKNANNIEIIKELGLENFILETDSPYLTPVPLRGQKNYPGNIIHIANFLSDCLNISPDEIANITNANIKNIFPKIIIQEYTWLK